MIEVNYLAILIAAIANMIVGFLWYGPLFGKEWMRLSGIDPQKIEAAKTKGMNTSYFLAFLGSIAMSYVLYHSMIFAGMYLGISGISAGISAGFWSWLGFVAPVTLATVLWDGKPWKLWALNASHYLVALLIMGGILGMWMQY